MTVIDIQNLTTFPIEEDFVRHVAKKTLQYSGIKGAVSMGVAFVGRAAAQKLNRQYGGKNKATDVLSFQSEGKFITPKITGKYLGEIVVCPMVVKKHATVLGTPFIREISHVIIHGILHLIGYGHTDNQRSIKRMHGREEKIMNRVL
ncbi:MAG: rRNA maturation RNase YbeY [Candidatus Spechtbacterales bacterium]